eukprot:COSAG02_NODE_878_length_16266_cov_8.886559_8_plen_461_part_00
MRNVTIRGLTIRDAALTYLGRTEADIHYNPSDSDWAIQRSGAVLLSGTEGFTFEQNHVTRCDGNGLFLSDYNRNVAILGNEFSYTGDNAMSSFGSTGRCLYQNCSVSLDYNSGLDGRPGNQPRYTRVVGNLVRELGLWQKQSGAWSQHLTAATHLESNVFFNGPHAAVDFNDGFGGGDVVTGNLMVCNSCSCCPSDSIPIPRTLAINLTLPPKLPQFNWNRQTFAHGVINAWERLPYISDIGIVRNFSKAPFNTTSEMPSLDSLREGYFPAYDFAPKGIGSVVSPFRRVTKNLLMANYNSLAAVLLDDAGSRFLMYDNYFVYGHWGVGESCHESQWVYGVGNLYAYTTSERCVFGLSASNCGTMISSEGPSPTGIRTFFYNNTMLNLADTDWCRNSEHTHLNLTQFWNNSVHSPGGVHAGPTCRGGGNTMEKPMPVADTSTMATTILAPFPKSGLAHWSV